MRIAPGALRARGVRVVVITKIFPSSLEPLSAPLNLQPVAELGRRCDVEVFEAIPHVPFARTLSVPARAAPPDSPRCQRASACRDRREERLAALLGRGGSARLRSGLLARKRRGAS